MNGAAAQPSGHVNVAKVLAFVLTSCALSAAGGSALKPVVVRSRAEITMASWAPIELCWSRSVLWILGSISAGPDAAAASSAVKLF